MKTKRIISIHLFFLLVILYSSSCKKESQTGENCSCPASGTPEQVNHTYDLVANGFFVFSKFHSIDNNDNVVFDSCLSHATQSYSAKVYPGKSTTPPLYSSDSAKVNGIKYTGYYSYTGFWDVTRTNFSTPRVCEFYGDSTKMYVTYNYTDNTLLPQFNGAALLPDSINLSQDLTLQIGQRNNILNTEVTIKNNFLDPPLPGLHFEIGNSQNSVTMKKQDLANLTPGYAYIIINLRNWSSTNLKKELFMFVSDHRYVKKIKLY